MVQACRQDLLDRRLGWFVGRGAILTPLNQGGRMELQSQCDPPSDISIEAARGILSPHAGR